MKHDILNIITNDGIMKFVIAVTIFLILDFITGITKAWRSNSIKSNKLKDGIVKIIIYFVFTGVGITIDFVFGLPNEEIKISVTKIFCCIMCGNDLVSIAENIRDWNLNIPDWIIKMFKKEVVSGNADNLNNEENEQITLDEIQNLLDER